MSAEAYVYNDLINRVEQINSEAAQYLKTDAMEMPSFSIDRVLPACFCWAETPQGFRYWLNISTQLGEQL